MKYKLLISLFIFPLVSSLATAQAPGGFNPESMFDGLDKDGDGKVAKSEATERQLQRWDQFDTNGDDFIDGDEQTAAIENIKARFANGGFRRPGGPGGFRGRGGDTVGGRPGGGPNPQARGGGPGRGDRQPGAGGRPGRGGPPPGNSTSPADDAERIDKLMSLDANGDDMVGPEEVGTQFSSLITRADTDGDGNASRAEIAAMVAQR